MRKSYGEIFSMVPFCIHCTCKVQYKVLRLYLISHYTCTFLLHSLFPYQVWSVAQGSLLQDLPLHWDFVNCVLYSPSGQHILSAADNGLIKVHICGATCSTSIPSLFFTCDCINTQTVLELKFSQQAWN